jgi:hypothetical protein
MGAFAALPKGALARLDRQASRLQPVDRGLTPPSVRRGGRISASLLASEQQDGGLALAAAQPTDRFQSYRTSGICATDAPRQAGRACESERQCGGTDGVTAYCLAQGFQGRRVRLSDRFESGSFDVRKPTDLRNPADQDSEGIEDPVAHLRGYEILLSKTNPPQPTHSPVRGLEIENEFHRRYGEPWSTP